MEENNDIKQAAPEQEQVQQAEEPPKPAEAVQTEEAQKPAEPVQTEESESGGAKGVLITIAMVVFALALGYVLTGFLFFKSHFNPGTEISGVNCTGLSVDAVKQKMANAAVDYKLEITDGGEVKDSLSAEDIGLKYNVSDRIDKVMTEQHPLAWGAGFFRKNNVELEDAFICDEEMVKAAVENLDTVKNMQDTPPVNASVYFDGDKYAIEEGAHGGKILTDKLCAAVKEAAEDHEESIDLLEANCYEMPEFTAESQKVKDACDLANKYISPKITMNMGPGAQHTIVDKELIHDWLFVTDNYDVYFDRKKVAAWVAEFAKTFNTYGQTREFLTAFGTRTTVKGGDFGWLIDQEAEVQSLVNVIKAGQDTVRYPVYSVMGVGHGNDDVGRSYVEVDLTNQHIYVWSDGKRVLDAPCVTGLPPNRITPPGTYRIKKKMSPAILVGDNYRTPVSYWMPFNRGIGLHDAVWQSSFGGRRYLTHGSHGCVNLSLSTAKQVYSYVYPGMPVVCYHINQYGVGKMMVLPDPSSTTTTTTTTTTETTTEITTSAPVTKTQPTTKAAQPTTKAPQPATKAQPATQAKPVTQAPQPATQAPQPVTQAPPPPVTQAPVPVTQAPVPVPVTEPPIEITSKQKEDVIVEPVVQTTDDDIIHEIVVQ